MRDESGYEGYMSLGVRDDLVLSGTCIQAEATTE